MQSVSKRNPFRRALIPSFPQGDAPLFYKTARGIDPTLLVLILLLAAAGTVTVFSAGFPYAENRYHNGYYFIERQIVWVVVGIGVMLLSLLPSSRFWYGIAPTLYAATILLLLAVLVIGIAGRFDFLRIFGNGRESDHRVNRIRLGRLVFLHEYFADLRLRLIVQHGL